MPPTTKYRSFAVEIVRDRVQDRKSRTDRDTDRDTHDSLLFTSSQPPSDSNANAKTNTNTNTNRLYHAQTLDLRSLSPSETQDHYAPITPRQQSVATQPVIPYNYRDTSPSPGTVVGIVLGSVAGFLLLVWLFWTLFNYNTGPPPGGYIEGDVSDIVVRRSHAARSRRSRRTRTARSTHSEMTERRSSRHSSPRPRRERIVVQETRRTERRAASIPPPPTNLASGSPERERVEIVEERITEERRVPGDDVIEVREDESISDEAPKRTRSKRTSGYRTVDPNAYGGGNYPQREMYDSRRSSRRYD